MAQPRLEPPSRCSSSSREEVLLAPAPALDVHAGVEEDELASATACSCLTRLASASSSLSPLLGRAEAGNTWVGVDALLLRRAEAGSTGKAGDQQGRSGEHRQGDVGGGGGWGSGVCLR
jgi:hypothetical protein